jgi:MFS family permease
MLNIVNYLDRNITSGVLPLLKEHFHASDTALGTLGTAFMLTYSLTALPFGIWSDRWKPNKVAAIGVGVWSVATVLSALAWSIESLFAFRALVGIGEAAYVATASTILSGQFPKNRRSFILGLFNLGMPIGGAAGVVLGGLIGASAGWQSAFAIVGVPGLILATLTWRMRLVTPSNTEIGEPMAKIRLGWSTIGALLGRPDYLFATLGYAGISYAFGAIVLFAPSLLERYWGYSVAQAGTLTGAIQVLAGLLGAPLGGWVSDLWQKRSPRGRAYTLTLAMALSSLFLFEGLAYNNLFCFFLSAFFMLWHVGVASAFIFDITERQIWNTAQALSMLIMHLLGDIPSAVLVGYISDRTNLHFSFSLLTIPMFLAALFFFAAGFVRRQ